MESPTQPSFCEQKAGSSLYYVRSRQESCCRELTGLGGLWWSLCSDDGLHNPFQVDREYRIISALYSAGFPVPRPLHYCSDASVIGTEFYIMQFVQGRIFRDFSVLELPAEEQKAVFTALVNTLTQLHNFDWQKYGLVNYGGNKEKGDFCQRQVMQKLYL